MSLLIYKYHTCSVYYPCDKPKLYKTGDALSNTFLQNYFWHNPSLQRLSDLFLNTFLYFSTSTISTIKNWFKKDFVEDSNYTYVGKTNKFLVNETANHVWYQGVQSDLQSIFFHELYEQQSFFFSWNSIDTPTRVKSIKTSSRSNFRTLNDYTYTNYNLNDFVENCPSVVQDFYQQKRGNPR